MKSIVKLFVFCLVLISILAACAAPTAAPTQPAAEPSGEEAQPVAETLSEAEAWAKANEVGPYQPETLDWAAIEAAAKKEGKVVVYANTSKIEAEIELFNAKYPDIKLEGSDLDDVPAKMREEQKAGNVIGDVYFASSGDLLYGEFWPKQYVWSFVPDNVVLPEVSDERPFAIARHGTDVVGYNAELNPDGCPLKNMWELTQPELKGKVFMEDPVSNPSTTAQIAVYTQHGDELAEAYKALYGKEWTEDEAYSSDLANAGWLFIKKLAQNSPGIQPGGDEVVEAFAVPGMTESMYGFTGYSKYKGTVKGELVFEPCRGLEPVIGFYKTTYLAIATGAQHPNAAKLFIHFVLSEEGRQPWNTIGDYPAAEGQEPAEGAIPLAELDVWTYDDLYNFSHVSEVRDFWAVNILGSN